VSKARKAAREEKERYDQMKAKVRYACEICANTRCMPNWLSGGGRERRKIDLNEKPSDLPSIAH